MGTQLSNGYVVFQNSTAYIPTLPEWAVNDVDNVRQQYFEGSKAESDSFYKLLGVLERIRDRQVSRERAYLTMRINELSNGQIKDTKRITQLQQALQTNDFTLAFNLEEHAEKELQSLRAQMNSASFEKITHTKKTFANDFVKVVKEKLKELLEVYDQGASQLFVSKGNLTIDDLYGNILDEILNGRQMSDITRLSFENYHAQFINAWRNFFEMQGIQLGSQITGATNILNQNQTFLNLKKNTLKSGKTGKRYMYKSSKGTSPVTYQQLLNSIARGIGQSFAGLQGEYEVQINAQGQSKSKMVLGTGAFRTRERHYIKDEIEATGAKTTQAKNDVYTVEIDGPKDLLQSIEANLETTLEQQKNISEERFYAYMDELLADYGKASGSVFYTKVYNVKKYVSSHNYQIQDSQTYDQFAARIADIGKSIDADKLVLMLSNTQFPGAYSSSQDIEVVSNYIASICAAWLWDDESVFFNQELDESAPVQQIQLFSAGGMLVPASQIMNESIQRLMSIGETEEQKRKLAMVTLRPYKGIVSEYENKIKQNTDWRARWDEVRNLALQKSKASVHFNQTVINDLLDKFKGVVYSQNSWL